MLNINNFFTDKTSEVMILQRHVLSSRSELRTLGNFDTAHVVFKYFAFEDRFGAIQRKYGVDFLKKGPKGMTSRIACERAMYSASVELRDISV